MSDISDMNQKEIEFYMSELSEPTLKVERALLMGEGTLQKAVKGIRPLPKKWIDPLREYFRKQTGKDFVFSQPEPADNERDKKLRAVMDKINQDYGAGTVMMLGDKPPMYEDVISTGSMGVDYAVGIKGLPRGRMVEIYGHSGCGKTTLAIHTMANAQKKGLRCLLIDAENTFDPEYATSLGLKVDELVYCQPTSAENGLETVDRHIGLVGVIVVDSVAALVPQKELEGESGDTAMGLMARLMSQACRKLTGSVSKTNTLCIFINQLRHNIGNMYTPYVTTGGTALGYYASLRLEVIKMAQIKDGEVSVGNRTKVKVVKNKCAPPFKTAEFDIIFGEGIDHAGEVVDIGTSLEIIKKAGSWYSYNGAMLGQGKDSVRKILKDNPEMANEIEDKILEKLNK